jgi:hypothetical protein
VKPLPFTRRRATFIVLEAISGHIGFERRMPPAYLPKPSDRFPHHGDKEAHPAFQPIGSLRVSIDHAVELSAKMTRLWLHRVEERTRCAGLVPLWIALRRIGCVVLFEFLNGPT